MNKSRSIFINLLTDFGFKYIFGREADKEFTISFLNALNITPTPIVDVTFIDKENKGESKEDRALIYDLHCKLEDDTKIIVEMQNRYQTHFDDRALYYLAADIHAQGQKGDEWRYKLTPVYGVFLMNFEWEGVEEQHLREDVCLYNMQTKSVFSDKMRMTFIKIPMMVKDADECRTTLERWIYILKNMEKMEAIPQSFTKDPVFRNLDRVAKYAALNEQDKAAYNKSLKAYRDAYAVFKTEREQGMRIGEEKGILKGRAEGLAEGRAEGLAEGLAEGARQSLMKNVRRMREKGLDDETIADLLNEPLDTVSSIN